MLFSAVRCYKPNLRNTEYYVQHVQDFLSFVILWHWVRDGRPWILTPAFIKQLTVEDHTHSRCAGKAHDAQTLRACGHIGNVPYTCGR